jgi:hypothetical protein
LPFGPLYFAGLAFEIGTWLLAGLFANIDERRGVPLRTRIDSDFQCRLAQGGEDGVLSYAVEPIAGVPRIGLLAVYQGMPVTAIATGDVLRHGMRFLPTTEVEIQSGEGCSGSAGVRKQTGLNQIARLFGNAAILRERHQALS